MSYSSLVEDFKAAKPILIDIFKQALSKNSTDDIFINISPYNNYSFIMKGSQIQEGCISIEIFLDIMIQRWEKELRYFDEIIQLKDSIYNELNKITLSEHENEYYSSKKIMIIDKVFDRLKIDEKMGIKEFCVSIMNGFDNEILQNFQKIALNLFFYSYPTPYPVGLLNFIEQTLLELTKLTINETSIHHSIQKILSFIDECLNVVILDSKINEITPSILENIFLKRKTCILKLYLDKKIQLLLPSTIIYKNSIQEIEIESTDECYALYGQGFICQKLALAPLASFYLPQVLINMPRTLTKLLIKGDFIERDTESFSNKLKALRYLDQLYLDFSGSAVTDYEIALLSKGLKKLKHLSTLILNFSYGKNCISYDGMSKLCESLQTMDQLKKFHLDVS